MKALSKAEQQELLEHIANMDKRMGKNNQKFTAKERKILRTNRVGNAYRKLQDSKNNYLQWWCFQKTSCLITANRSDDNKGKPEWISDYDPPSTSYCCVWWSFWIYCSCHWSNSRWQHGSWKQFHRYNECTRGIWIAWNQQREALW